MARIVRRLRACPASATLADLMAGSGGPCGVELSFQIAPGRLSHGRFLLTQSREAFTPRAAAAFWAGLGRLGLRDAEAEAEAAAATFWHLGYEPGAIPVCKFYAEFEASPEPAMVPLYRAWKWRRDGRGARQDRYLRLRPGDVAGRAAAILPDLPDGLSRPLADLVADGGPDIFALWVEGHDGGRRSLDLRLYERRLRIAEIAPVVEEAGRAFGVPATALADVLAEHGQDRLGHLAFGISAAGEGFITVYGGAAMLRPLALA